MSDARRCLAGAAAGAVASAGAACAVQPDEMLADPALEARARALSAELRCMVCQNQSIDDSDADLARDLRVLVRERLIAGDSDAEVIDFVVARYGEFVLLKPRFNLRNALLWGTPVLLLADRRRVVVVLAAAIAPRRWPTAAADCRRSRRRSTPSCAATDEATTAFAQNITKFHAAGNGAVMCALLSLVAEDAARARSRFNRGQRHHERSAPNSSFAAPASVSGRRSRRSPSPALIGLGAVATGTAPVLAEAVRVEAPQVAGLRRRRRAASRRPSSASGSRPRSSRRPMTAPTFDDPDGFDNLPDDHPLKPLLPRVPRRWRPDGQRRQRRFSRRDRRRQPRPVAQGSGFFISEDGYLVTNNHVVEDGADFTVVIDDGNELDAKLIGTDPRPISPCSRSMAAASSPMSTSPTIQGPRRRLGRGGRQSRSASAAP